MAKTAKRTQPKAAKAESAVDLFLERCRSVAKKRGIKLSTLSAYVVNDGKVLPRVVKGGDIGTRKLEAAEVELAKMERGEPTTYELALGYGKPAKPRASGRSATAG